MPLPRFVRKIALGLVERANYTLIETGELERERRAADMNLRRLQASGLLEPPQPDSEARFGEVVGEVTKIIDGSVGDLEIASGRLIRYDSICDKPYHRSV